MTSASAGWSTGRSWRAIFSGCFFNDTATTEFYTLSLHDALPISRLTAPVSFASGICSTIDASTARSASVARSEEHTSELQSRQYLVCRLLLEKKKNTNVESHLLRHDIKES